MASDRSGAAEFTRFHSQNELRNKILKLIVWVVAILLLTAVALVFGKMLFSLKTIVVDGTGHYSYTQILNAADLSEGDFIFFVSEKKLNEKLTNAFSYVRSVKVEKQYPGTVTITLEEEEPIFYFELQKEYYLLSESLRVLDRFREEAKLLEAAPDTQLIKIPTVSRAVVGSPLEFALESKSRHTDEALSLLIDSRLYEGVTAVDFSNRFDMTIIYENRFEIHLGSFEDYAYKLDLALGMIHAYSSEATGKFEIIYDANNELQGIAKVDEPQKS